MPQVGDSLVDCAAVRYRSSAGCLTASTSMSLKVPSAWRRMTSFWYPGPTSQLPGPGVGTLRWFAQKSTITSKS